MALAAHLGRQAGLCSPHVEPLAAAPPWLAPCPSPPLHEHPPPTVRMEMLSLLLFGSVVCLYWRDSGGWGVNKTGYKTLATCSRWGSCPSLTRPHPGPLPEAPLPPAERRLLARGPASCGSLALHILGLCGNCAAAPQVPASPLEPPPLGILRPWLVARPARKELGKNRARLPLPLICPVSPTLIGSGS